MVADSGACDEQRPRAARTGSPVSSVGDADSAAPKIRNRVRVVIILVVMLGLVNILVTVYDFWHSHQVRHARAVITANSPFFHPQNSLS
ncbi:MAG TPA: hypothetical protein VET88_05045 [Gammaproteobacteria bacterium]|nr:hypothetical protein [Gammaproteobacteria bacterium]